jgi:hypothetical protein
MTQKHVGHVIDTDGIELEVWLESDNGVPQHVYVLYGGSPQADFPFAKPRRHSALEVTAQRVAAGEAKTLAVFMDTDVIDEADTKALHNHHGNNQVH